jgi:hypothetical protein
MPIHRAAPEIAELPCPHTAPRFIASNDLDNRIVAICSACGTEKERGVRHTALDGTFHEEWEESRSAKRLRFPG